MNKYQWKLKGLFKGVDANVAVQELQRIEKENGELTTEVILKSANEEDSPLHPLFLWSNDEAAHKYRLSQAASILNNISVLTISDGEERQISVYEVVRTKNGGSYKHIESFSDDDIEQIRVRTIRELNAIRSKLGVYDNFKKVTEKIGEALDSF